MDSGDDVAFSNIINFLDERMQPGSGLPAAAETGIELRSSLPLIRRLHALAVVAATTNMMANCKNSTGSTQE